MIRTATMASLAALSLCLGLAQPSLAAKPDRQAQSCRNRAAQEGLEGRARSRFIASCERGSLAPKHRTTPAPQSKAAEALTAPSGADRSDRSQQCNAEAGRRGLAEGALQAFRKGCLASAAPVTAIQTSTRSEAPAEAKPKLDALTAAPPPR